MTGAILFARDNAPGVEDDGAEVGVSDFLGDLLGCFGYLAAGYENS